MRALLITAGLCVALDQLTKIWVVFWLDLQNRLAIDVLPPLLNFRYGENRGINFGLMRKLSDMLGESASVWLLVAVAVAISAFVTAWVLRSHRACTVMLISAGLVVGGALGNVYDRLAYGYVLDFLNMSCCGIRNPFVFNVADIFIFAGAAGLILFEGRAKKPA